MTASVARLRYEKTQGSGDDGWGSYLHRIPTILFETAEKPIGRIPVRLGKFEIAHTKVDDSGAASFRLPPEIHEKILKKQLEVRTLFYHPNEDGEDAQASVKIVGLFIFRTSNANSIAAVGSRGRCAVLHS
jgi:hypothetical protein